MKSFTFIDLFIGFQVRRLLRLRGKKPDFGRVEAIKVAHFRFLSRISAKGSEDARVARCTVERREKWDT